MQPYFEAYFDQLQEMHAEIDQALDGLPPEALDWVPGPDMNSLAVLITHTAGAERYWIGDVAAQIPSARDREAEFQARGLDSTALRASLSEKLAFAREVLTKLTLADLEEQRVSPMHGQPYTVGWALAHALQHTANHVGHVQIMRQLWHQRRE